MNKSGVINYLNCTLGNPVQAPCRPRLINIIKYFPEWFFLYIATAFKPLKNQLP